MLSAQEVNIGATADIIETKHTAIDAVNGYTPSVQKVVDEPRRRLNASNVLGHILPVDEIEQNPAFRLAAPRDESANGEWA